MSIFSALLDLFYPPVCCGCGTGLSPFRNRDLPVCPECMEKTKPLGGPRCPGCGKPFRSAAALRFSPAHLCGRCRKRRPHFDGACSGWEYDGVVREMIHRFKYRKRIALGKKLTRCAMRFFPLLPPVDGILPVPLHPRRLREREFNQSLVIAGIIAYDLGLPLFRELLMRTRATPPQVELTFSERVWNMRGAFEMKKGTDVAGKKLILVDDVFTSGSTVNECARVLKEAGAEKVYVVTLARTVEDRRENTSGLFL